MPSDDNFELEFEEILKETAAAFLFRLADGETVWIPYSQCRDNPDDYKQGDKNGSISITQWIAEKKGLA